MTEHETEVLKSQTAISNENEKMWSQSATSLKNKTRKHRGKKYIPYFFTEQEIAILSGLLRNEKAVQVNINIMNAFVEMRKFISLNGQVFGFSAFGFLLHWSELKWFFSTFILNSYASKLFIEFFT